MESWKKQNWRKIRNHLKEELITSWNLFILIWIISNYLWKFNGIVKLTLKFKEKIDNNWDITQKWELMNKSNMKSDLLKEDKQNDEQSKN
jgi:hypothetical protein